MAEELGANSAKQTYWSKLPGNLSHSEPTQPSTELLTRNEFIRNAQATLQSGNGSKEKAKNPPVIFWFCFVVLWIKSWALCSHQWTTSSLSCLGSWWSPTLATYLLNNVSFPLRRMVTISHTILRSSEIVVNETYLQRGLGIVKRIPDIKSIIGTFKESRQPCSALKWRTISYLCALRVSYSFNSFYTLKNNQKQKNRSSGAFLCVYMVVKSQKVFFLSAKKAFCSLLDCLFFFFNHRWHRRTWTVVTF